MLKFNAVVKFEIANLLLKKLLMITLKLKKKK